jgi:hypothetical protein
LKYQGGLSVYDDELGVTLAADRDWLVVGALPGGSNAWRSSVETEYPQLVVYRFDPNYSEGPRYVKVDELGSRVSGVWATGVLADISDEQIAWNGFTYRSEDGVDHPGAWLFRWNGTTFAPRYHVAAPSNVDLCPLGTDYCRPEFPTDVSLSHNTLVLSAPGADIVVGSPAANAGNYTHAGRAFIYDVSGAAPVLQANLFDVATTSFGYRVRVSGDVAAIGSKEKIHMYRRSGSTWTLEQVLPCSGVYPFDLDRNLLVSSSGCGVAQSPAGVVTVYRHGANGWTFDQSILPIDYTPALDFGRSLSVSGDRIVVGAKNGNWYAGAAYVYKHDPARFPAWQGVRLLTGLKQVRSGTKTTFLGTEAGWSVAAAGNAMIVGEPTNQYWSKPSNLPQVGKVHVYMDCPYGSGCGLQYCAPSTPVCGGGAAATCDADGLGSTVSTDCSQSGLACDQGACVSALCTPGSGRCVDRSAQRCSDDGLNWITVDTCKDDEYCTTGDGLWPLGCHTKSCQAGAEGCFFESAGTCNQDASGLLSPATNCRTSGQACAGGTCAAPLFYDGFENSSFANWVEMQTSVGIKPAITTEGAMNTSRALVLGNNDLIHTFPAGLQPRYLGFWSRGSYFTLTVIPSDNQYLSPFGVAFEYGDTKQSLDLFANKYKSTVSWPTARTDAWDLIEFRNIDWAARTFDFYYNGDLLVPGAVMLSGSDVGAIKIGIMSSGELIDEIMMW